ncbi:MAG: SAM-dependent methyltransferase [Ilumatobacteraceae bacterium]|nr:SAM-dependent methyltransferase [Ilumatobacteraceae bacterium]
MVRVDPSAFDEMYRETDDPWGFATAAYELQRYATTLASLARPRYRRCFEPACAIGVLTEGLAARADHVVACDGSTNAIDQAVHRLAEVDNVDLLVAAIPEWWPTGTFDLIVLSELGYYWDAQGWAGVIDRCRESLTDGGEVIAVHWLGSSPDHVTNGRDVHEQLIERLGASDLHLERVDEAKDGFVLDRWSVVRRG